MAQRGRNVARYLTIAMTQGSADSFIQGSVNTGINPEDGLGLQVVGAEFIIGSSQAAISADSSIFWSLTRDTKTAVAAYNDDESIFFDGVSCSLTTSGQILLPARHSYPPQDGIFIVEPTIYGQLSSTSTGLTMVAYWRVYYQEVSLTEIDILRILNNS